MIVEILSDLSPVIQAILATFFTWGVTALGAGTVFLTSQLNQKVLDWLLGFAGGVMIAASFWSLLAPAIEMAEQQGVISWVPAVIGFLLGGAFLRLIDFVLPHLHVGAPLGEAEGLKTTWRWGWLLALPNWDWNRLHWQRRWRWQSASVCKISLKVLPSLCPCADKV